MMNPQTAAGTYFLLIVVLMCATRTETLRVWGPRKRVSSERSSTPTMTDAPFY